MKFRPKLLLVILGLSLGLFLVYPGKIFLISAKTLWEGDQNLTNEYSSMQKSYIQALGIYKEAHNDYNAALKIFLSSKKTSQDKEELKVIAKNLFLKANEALISYVNLVKKKIGITRFLTEKEKQDFLKICDNHLSLLSSQRTKITNLTGIDSTKSLAGEIKEEGKKIEIDAKKIAGYIMVSRVNLFITKAEELLLKIEEKIEILEIQGKNTTEIQKWLLDFKTKNTLAKDKVNIAKGKFEAIKGSNTNSLNLFNEGLEIIKEAKQIEKEAHDDLKKIVTSFKKQKNTKVISGAGTLEVKGNGKITLKGKGRITGFVDSEGSGVVVITDNKGDVKIDTKSKGQKEDLGENQVRYTGIGEIIMSGSDMEVQIKGAKIDIKASGLGIAYLKGEGTYKIEKDTWVNIPEEGLNIRIKEE